jgi:hypothetical protein
MKRKIVLLAIATTLALTGCGPKPNTGVPDFMLNPPKEAGRFYGAAEAEKQTLQMAKDIADSRACREVARQLGQRVQEIVKDFQEQSGQGAKSEFLEFSQSVGKTIVDMNLSGCSIQKRELREGEGTVKVYSLASLDAAKALEAARQAVESNKAKVAATAAFQELDKTLQNRLGQ